MPELDEDLYDLNEYSAYSYEESDSFVPATENVRATYATDYYMVEVGSRGTVLGRAAAFDRWLAGVRANAWEQGYNAALIRAGGGAFIEHGEDRHNPYT